MGWELRSDRDIAGLKLEIPVRTLRIFSFVQGGDHILADRDIRYRHGHELAEPSPARMFFINICPPRVNVSGSTPLGPGAAASTRTAFPCCLGIGAACEGSDAASHGNCPR